MKKQSKIPSLARVESVSRVGMLWRRLEDYSAHKSFYGKARVVERNENAAALFSMFR